jgi:methylglyoxal synthase
VKVVAFDIVFEKQKSGIFAFVKRNKPVWCQMELYIVGHSGISIQSVNKLCHNAARSHTVNSVLLNKKGRQQIAKFS